MRIALLAALAVACAPAPPPMPGGPGAFVRVLTWNVHDLFDEWDRLAPPGAADEVPPPEEVEAKLERIAEVLVRADADLVFLQEVENAPLLARLAARAGLPEARLVEGADPRGIDVAVLSRLPLESYRSHLGELDADGEPLWSRDCVEVHADVPLGAAARRLVVVGSHLASRVSDPDGSRRRAQATRMRAIADAVAASLPDALVLAGGDLNDTPDAAALAPLLGGEAWIDPAARLPPAAAWTWGGDRRIDYLLVAARSAGALLAAQVLAGEDVAAASDHRPVVLDLWVR
jgi:endonuclease/exonuclease/phosphatase family metal-dependent hydrolase